MSNTVEFRIKISDMGGNVLRDIKTSVASVSDVVAELTEDFKTTGGSIREAANEAFRFNQVKEVLQSVSDMLGDALAPAKQFNQAMRETNTMARLGEADFNALKKSVHDLGLEIPIARDLLAKGLYQVISNGVPQDNWLTFLETSSRSAVGGLANLEKVVTVTSTIVKNYGLSWEAAAEIQDKIQNTAKNGVTNFEQLAEALPRVSGSAATLGVSVDELLASFATLTGVSGNTAEVSTQLAAIMNALIKPTSEAAKMAQAMGIEFNAAAIKASGGLIPFLQSTSTAIQEHSSKTGMLKEEIFGLLFSSAEALRAVLPLTGELAGKWSENSAVMASSAGTMNEAFAQMGDTADATSLKLANWAAGFSDIANTVMGSSQPYITFIAQTGIAFTQLAALGKILKSIPLKSFIASLGASKIALALKSAATAIATATSGAFSYALKGLTIALGSARIATIALWSAITLGASFLIQAVIELIVELTGVAEDYSNEMGVVSDTTEDYNETLAQSRSQMKLLIAELASFNGSKEDEKKRVSELNATYSDAFGQYNTLAQWYDTLVSKSELYCQMMVSEAKTRALVDKIAKKEIEADSLKSNLPQGSPIDPTIDPMALNAPKPVFSNVNSESLTNARKLKEINASIVADEAVLTAEMKNQATIRGQLQIGSQKPKPVIKQSGGGGVTELGLLGQIEAKIKEINVLKAKSNSTDDIAGYNVQLKQLDAQRKALNDITPRTPMSATGISPETIKVGKIDTSSAIADLTILRNPFDIMMELRLKGVDKATNELARLHKQLSVAKTPDERKHIQKQIDAWNGYAESMTGGAKSGEIAGQVIGGLGGAMGDLAGVVGGSTGVWLDYAGNVLQAVAQMIPALVAVSMGQATAQSMGLPPPFNFIALGLSLASVAAAFATIPKFADGGIAYGPTLGLFGEYSGAANNPEVVAPLNKLRSLIGPQGGGYSEVRFKIEGRDLVGIIQKNNKINNRSFNG